MSNLKKLENGRRKAALRAEVAFRAWLLATGEKLTFQRAIDQALGKAVKQVTPDFAITGAAIKRLCHPGALWPQRKE
jgi:hypothetical protein